MAGEHQHPRGRVTSPLRWGGLLVILSMVVLKCLANVPAMVWFDVDPLFDASRLVGISVPWSLWIDATLLIACAAGLIGEVFAGRRADWVIITLGLTPLPVILYHGAADGGDLWRGAAWLSSALAAVTIAHLARDRTMRAVVVGVLVGVIVPLLIRGLFQVTTEHDATLAEFRAAKHDFLAQRGWPEGSPAALMYERRLMQPHPTGWFTTTNVYGTLMAAACVTFAGLLLGTWRARLQSGYVGVCALLGICAALGVWLTDSLGALGALSMALMVWGIGIGFGGRGGSARRFMLPAAVALTIVAVVVRGLLPEDFAGDLSLLFRWHYWQAAWDVFTHNVWSGVGPEGFQDVYTRYRVPRNPEEVMSAHNMFLDWIATLGVSGGAWIALAGALLWRAARAAAAADERAEPLASAHIWMLSGLAVAPGALAAILAEGFRLDTGTLMVRQFGAIGLFVAVGVSAMIVMRIDARGRSDIVRWSLACAALAVVVHSQIEMTFHEVNASLWAWVLLGAAASTHAPSTRASGRDACVAQRCAADGLALLLAATSVWIAINGAVPAMRQQRITADAAALFNETNLPRVEGGQLRIADVLRQRERAAEMLVIAYNAWPINVRPLEAAARQLMRTTEVGGPGGPIPARLLMRGVDLARQAVDTHDRASSRMLLTLLHRHLAEAFDDPAHLNAAIAIMHERIDRDPHSNILRAQLGDLYWQLGEFAAARQAYATAMENDANFALDPLKQMSEPERVRIRMRLSQRP